jgi:hypothetical protein
MDALREGSAPYNRDAKADEVDGSRSRHLSAKIGCCHANPSKGAIRHGY